MNKLNAMKRAQIIAALVEGNSINATVRMTGAAKHTVLKLLADLGKACTAYQDRAFRNLPCKRIQCDEIWSFCYAKEKNVPEEYKGQFGFGDVWTWTALCADTKLVPCWLIGGRNAQYASKFMSDLAGRLANQVQLTTDGHKAYLDAVFDAFGHDIDYAMLEKIYSNPPTGAQTRYSPGVCCGAKKKKITGNPEKQQVQPAMWNDKTSPCG